MKTIQLKDQTPVFNKAGFDILQFVNHNGNVLLLDWEQVIDLITNEGYRYISFY